MQKGLQVLDAYDAIGLTIGAHGGTITGRTTLQKLIYFATIKIPEIDVTYSHHYYGPFSREVAVGVEDLTAYSYLEEKIIPHFTYESYEYELTTEGIQLAEKVKTQYGKQYEIISDIVKICDDFCELRANPLSYAAKAYYIITNSEKAKKSDSITVSDIREVAKDFDWKISKDDAEIGVNLLQKLSLVTLV